MNTKLLLYGAIGFFAIRYFIKQRQTAAAAPIVSLPLPDQSREQQIFDVIPVTPVNTMPSGSSMGPQGPLPNITNQNNPYGGQPGGGRPGQL